MIAGCAPIISVMAVTAARSGLNGVACTAKPFNQAASTAFVARFGAPGKSSRQKLR